jgi:DNA polymerase III subunit chi
VKVEFHSGIGDPLAHACRLLRKAHAAGARVVVRGPSPLLDRLDEALWTFDALSFVPHLRLRAGTRATAPQRRTPLWLVDTVDAVDDRDVLVNLGAELAAGWESFGRVIEIVAADTPSSTAARQRWRRYAQTPGVEMVHHAAGGAS